MCIDVGKQCNIYMIYIVIYNVCIYIDIYIYLYTLVYICVCVYSHTKLESHWFKRQIVYYCYVYNKKVHLSPFSILAPRGNSFLSFQLFFIFYCVFVNSMLIVCFLDSLKFRDILLAFYYGGWFSIPLFQDDIWVIWWTNRWGFPGGSDSKASAYNAGDPGSIPGLGRCPGEGNGSPLQYPCLKNPMDGGAW